MKELQVAYIGNIDRELDEVLYKEIPEMVERYQSTAEWYFQEASVREPLYRVMGFELSSELEEFAKIELIYDIIDRYDGQVVVIQF